MKTFAAVVTLLITGLIITDYMTHPAVSGPLTTGAFSFFGTLAKLTAGQTG